MLLLFVKSINFTSDPRRVTMCPEFWAMGVRSKKTNDHVQARVSEVEEVTCYGLSLELLSVEWVLWKCREYVMSSVVKYIHFVWIWTTPTQGFQLKGVWMLVKSLNINKDEISFVTCWGFKVNRLLRFTQCASFFNIEQPQLYIFQLFCWNRFLGNRRKYGF